MKLSCRDLSLPLEHTAVVGVVNVTPDSFSDGGLWLDAAAAVKHGLEMVDQGAALIDVGGESTRPGAESVPADEECRRILPVIEALVRDAGVPVSVDTRKVEVAERALDMGAHVVNDTAGEEADPRMDDLAHASGAGVIVMHSRGSPATMRALTDYEDVVVDVREFLVKRAGELEQAGVARDSICLDPGFGFAKTPQQNLVLLNRLHELTELGYPILAGTSRKSFIGQVLDLDVDQRLEGTLATVVVAVAAGARLVRVHDVEPTVRAVRMTEAILSAGH